jgi:hypothetical protein
MSLQNQILDIPIKSYDLLTINPSFNLGITVNSGLPLSYASANNSVVNTDQNGNITITGPGTTLVRFFNSGNLNWNPVEGEVLIKVTKKTQSIMFFYIDNKYLDSEPFLLTSYGYSSSGLPLKFKCLSPNIAEIDENSGNVVIKNVGTVYFEVSQEGSFEWEAVKIIKEFGVSYRNYPFELDIKSRSSNTLIKLNLYKSENEELFLLDSISGGLYFTSPISLNKDLFLPTGDYIGIINYENVESGVNNSNLNTTYSFSHSEYIGCKGEPFLIFLINRTGFINYKMDIIVQAVLEPPYKYGSKEAIQTGFFWSGVFDPNKTGVYFVLPILNNNKLERTSAGKLGFSFVNANRIPKEMRQTNINNSNFIIKDPFTEQLIDQNTNGLCTGTIESGFGLLPYYPQDLGLDFYRILTIPSLIVGDESI